MNTFVISEEDGLKHYGILGMKWGVRRYQYKSGALTPAGKKRYGSSIYNNTNEAIEKINKGKKAVSNYLKKTYEYYKTHNDYAIYASNLHSQITKGNDITNNILRQEHISQMSIQQANEFAMQESRRASINASLQAASLSMTNGTNPFMFGMF